MKRTTTISAAIILLIIMTCCSNKDHFISDAQQRADVQQDLNDRMAQLPDGDLFSAFNENIPQKEKEALQFLYAYMPLCDITDYSSSYYMKNIEASFKAKDEMPWGKDIPEREFNHFVMPVRINNENLDDSRIVFYNELKDRVKDLSLYDAVLEVNHWCHEKANYKGSDSRTSSPLATVKTSWGRCGEESTFLVAALRSVCIPARQVYTPRWAHCDDNHAWVEAYVDGQWHFLGACEPEPVLDLGWFNAPASRCLLLHTRVFGRYYGPEEVIETTANHTEINVVDNYAETAKVIVNVQDTDGKPVAGARVDFKIYNYAEFNTVATKYADNQGKSWLTAGKGDMMIYASKDGRFGYEVVSFGKKDEVTIALDKQAGMTYSEEYDIVPPHEKSNIPEVTPAMRAENDRRFASEDSIRNAYIATCDAARGGVYNPSLDSDEQLINGIMEKTWGNYQTIKDFLKYATEKNRRGMAVSLLKELTDKDLRDVTMDVLIDNLDYTVEVEGATFEPYVLNPRVSNEMIRPYKKEFCSYFTEQQANEFRSNPQKLIDWVKANIKIHNEMNVRSIPMLPTGVMKAKAADNHSRNIFFVALSRSIGNAARIDPVTGKVQYYWDSKWVDVNFDEKGEAKTTETGILMADYQSDGILTDPRYYSHFSIKKFDGNTFDLLSYDAKDPGMDVGAQYSELFANGLELDPGYYALISGTRLADGSVLSRLIFFNIEAGKTTNIDLVMREPVDGVKIIGNYNSENRIMTENQEDKSLLQISGRGFYLIGLMDGGSEPTTHVMQEMGLMKEEFQEWGRSIIFVFQNQEMLKNFKLKNFKDLPSNITYGIGNDGMISEAVRNMKLKNNNLPIFMIANTNNEVVFVSQGYTIGLAEQMMKVFGGI